MTYITDSVNSKDPFYLEALKYFDIKKSEFNKEQLHKIYQQYVKENEDKLKYNLSMRNEVQMYNYYNIINYRILEFFERYNNNNIDDSKLKMIEQKVKKNYNKRFKK